MSVIGKSGTKLSFTSRKPTMINNKRIQCFDGYWGKTPPGDYGKKSIYFTFDYLHIQTEEFVKELNKILSYVQIEFIDKKEKTIWSYNDSYGKRYSTSIVKVAGKEGKKHKVLTGKYKIVFDDFFLDKIKEDFKNNYRYGSVAQTIGYLCHHILCSLAVSEGWLTNEEKFSKIKYSDYGVEDFAGFVAYLSTNRNTSTNRRLSTDKISGTDVKQIGNKKKIQLICKYSQLFTIGKQTQTLYTFRTPLQTMQDKVLLAESKRKEFEKVFGKEGEFAIITKRYKKYTYTAPSGETMYEDYFNLIRIRRIDLVNLTIYWDIIYSSRKSTLKVTGSGLTSFTQSNYRFTSSSFIKDKETGKFKLRKFGATSAIKGITKVNKRTKNNKTVKATIESLEAIVTKREKELPGHKKYLDSAIKIFDGIKVPTPEAENFETEYRSYTSARGQFFTERKRYDAQLYQINLLKNVVNQIQLRV